MTLKRTYEEAADWLSRQDGEAMDWEGFTFWLEADPRHRAAFDELALIELRLEENAPRISQLAGNDRLSPVNRPRAGWGGWAGLGGVAIAASLAALLWFYPHGEKSWSREFRSPSGKMVQIALSDGSRIALAPASELKVAHGEMDLRGSAFFDIPHRPGRTLNISVGDFRVSDIGTRFSIESEPGVLSVEVAQGRLKVSSDRLAAEIGLSAGQGLFADGSRGRVRLTAVEPEQVGSWRSGKLQFDNAPLALVAEEISRYSGTELTVDPRIAGRKFSGVIAINHGQAPVQTLARILSLEVKTVGGASRLEPRLN